ncbi:hypothetical protein PRUPE_3G128400 [Prunus persica]|uniref:Uncharacterized protein n=1 Tax=Prunus persica TaxID=3760 RepID=A0A251PZB3_PRUPE|nr:hypothetical protein PRUPE_3G128400 [Prunus persica]
MKQALPNGKAYAEEKGAHEKYLHQPCQSKTTPNCLFVHNPHRRYQLYPLLAREAQLQITPSPLWPHLLKV